MVTTNESRETTYEPRVMTRTKRMMISQPMAGKTEEEIVATREKAIDFAKKNGYEFIGTMHAGDIKKSRVVNVPLYYLAESLKDMSVCDVVYFAKLWENARGCKIEHDAALAYDLEIVYE